MSTVPPVSGHVVNSHLPHKVDWNHEGYVTDPREYHHNCNAQSYAMSAADMVEALHKKRTGHLEKLSAKQFIDCQNLGCDSGDTGDSLRNFNQSSYKVYSDRSYPFNEYGHEKCKVDPHKGDAMVYQVIQIDGNMDAIKEALQHGPITGALYASD